jgi:hypothetical protein
MEFSDVALAKFLQTAPELTSSIIVFKDCTEELTNESDIQVGIFVLRTGDDILYVPVVSKGDGVYPIDSVFISSKNKFFPLTKNTIEKIMNTQKMTMGQPKKIPTTVDVNPSVQHLVNPPRTGKFAYASGSRLVEFLASMPTSLKEQVLEKFSSDSEVYNKLHRLFDLKNLVAALNSNLHPATQPADRSIGVRILTGGENLPTFQALSILTKGYAVDGENPTTRVALSTENYWDGFFTKLSALDAGYDYDIAMKDGSIRRAFVPVKKLENGMGTDLKIATGESDPQFLLFEDGSYTINRGAVTVGQKDGNRSVLKSLFSYKPPILLKNANSDDKIAIFDENMGFIGAYRVSRITQDHNGCVVTGYDLINHGSVKIHGIRGYTKTAYDSGAGVFVPSTSIVMLLTGSSNSDVETSVQAAATRKAMMDWAMLNTSLNLTYDNVEFHVNGKPMGKEAEVMKHLVEGEGINPTVAESFVKKAKETKKCVVYLSKKASSDFNTPGEIPQFGNMPPKQVNPWGSQQDNLPMDKLKGAVNTDDAQSVESIVISELLQAPDMQEYVREYIPDIEEAIDRLGRILLLGRIHINKLGEGNEADEVFNLLSGLKNVYRMLGDNLIRLESLANTSSGKDPK